LGFISSRVYCGKPSSQKDPKGYAARRRQISRWEADGPVVQVITRPLRYPHNYPSVPAQEKGIDVALAIDCVTMAIRAEYDIAIIMSEDTDRRPALEFVHSLQNGPQIEVACWEPPLAPTHGLTVPRQRIEVHALDSKAY
jgi:NYN domain